MANKKNRQESLPTSTGLTFKVGDGVHWGWDGDRFPGTVMAVSDSGREVYVSTDKFLASLTGNTGPQEGDVAGSFETVYRDIDECIVFKLSRNGEAFKQRHFNLQPMRRFARNPSV